MPDLLPSVAGSFVALAKKDSEGGSEAEWAGIQMVGCALHNNSFVLFP